MRQHIREVLEFFDGVREAKSPEERKVWDEQWARVGKQFRMMEEHILRKRRENPEQYEYTDKLWNMMMNDPEGKRIFNEELERLLGPEEGNDGNRTTPNLGP